MQPHGPQMSHREPVLNQSEDHSDTRRSEAVVPIGFLTQRAAYKRADKCSEVDAHVKNAKACVSPRSPFRIKLADHRAHIRLEQPGAEHDQNQPYVKAFGPRYSEGEVTQGDNNAPVPDSLLSAQDSIRKPSSRQRRQINRRCIEAVNRGRHLICEPHSSSNRVHHEEDKQCSHSVITQPLPHFGEKKRVNSARTAW